MVLTMPRFRPCSQSDRAIGIASCDRGTAAIEFSLLVLPLVLLILGILQFYSLHITQTTLADYLYQSASKPECEPELLAGNKSGYKSKICAKSAFPSTCNSNIKLEMAPIQSFTDPISTTKASPITGTIFDKGSSNDVLILRATITVDRFLPLTSPLFTAKASAVFRRPNPSKLCT